MMVSSFGVPDECLVAIIRLFETTTLMTRGKQSRNEEEEEEEEARGGGKRRPQRGDHASLRVADVMTKSKFVQFMISFLGFRVYTTLGV